LSIRERIELLKGRMKIASVRGRGSRFVIVTPASEEVPPSPVSEAQPNQPGTAEPHAEHRLRVLVADDHEVVRQGLVALLSEEHTVEVVGEAANGREAVDLADRLHPDVVIMDIAMPLLDGDAATRQIKACRPQTRVIALSMHEEPEMREAMHEAGVESYVLKTAPAEELLAAIRGREAVPY
jgi:CheY-like chemotaxis protein